MHAAVNFIQIQPGKMNEAIAIVRDSVDPAASQQQGNRGFILLTDANTNKAIAVALWDTEADAAAVISNGWYQEQVAKLTDVIAQHMRGVYEVIVESTASEETQATCARVNYRQLQPGKMDEAIRTYRETTVPAFNVRQGGAGGFVLADRSTDKIMAI